MIGSFVGILQYLARLAVSPFMQVGQFFWSIVSRRPPREEDRVNTLGDYIKFLRDTNQLIVRSLWVVISRLTERLINISTVLIRGIIRIIADSLAWYGIISIANHLRNLDQNITEGVVTHCLMIKDRWDILGHHLHCGHLVFLTLCGYFSINVLMALPHYLITGHLVGVPGSQLISNWIQPFNLLHLNVALITMTTFYTCAMIFLTTITLILAKQLTSPKVCCPLSEYDKHDIDQTQPAVLDFLNNQAYPMFFTGLAIGIGMACINSLAPASTLFVGGTSLIWLVAGTFLSLAISTLVVSHLPIIGVTQTSAVDLGFTGRDSPIPSVPDASICFNADETLPAALGIGESRPVKPRSTALVWVTPIIGK